MHVSTPILGEISWETLYYADVSSLTTPFRIILKDGLDVICYSILRLLPGKRLVAEGILRKQEVIVKLFFNREQSRAACAKEAHGLKLLAKKEICAPSILYVGEAAYQNYISLLITEKITASQSLKELWNAHNDRQALSSWVYLVTQTLALQHNAGVLQKDLHLNNFLINPQLSVVYTIDGSTIHDYKTPLPKKVSIYYLALFFTQLGINPSAHYQMLFEVFCKIRGFTPTPHDFNYILRTMKKILKKKRQHFLKKVFRNSTQFKKIDTPSQKGMYDRNYKTPSLMACLAHPESIFLKSDTQILKADSAATIVKACIDGKFYIIKRYQYADRLHRIKRFFCKTRVALEWSFAQLLIEYNLGTAKPVAFIDEVTICNGKSYIITEFVEGMHIGEFFVSFTTGSELHHKTADRFFSILKNLAALKLVHGDLKMTNILIDKDGQPFLIDLEKMKQFRFLLTLNKALKKDIKNFMRNWENRTYLKTYFEMWWSRYFKPSRL